MGGSAGCPCLPAWLLGGPGLSHLPAALPCLASASSHALAPALPTLQFSTCCRSSQHSPAVRSGAALRCRSRLSTLCITFIDCECGGASGARLSPECRQPCARPLPACGLPAPRSLTACCAARGCTHTCFTGGRSPQLLPQPVLSHRWQPFPRAFFSKTSAASAWPRRLSNNT